MKKGVFGKRLAALLIAAAVCVSEAAGVMAAVPAGTLQEQDGAWEMWTGAPDEEQL